MFEHTDLCSIHMLRVNIFMYMFICHSGLFNEQLTQLSSFSLIAMTARRSRKPNWTEEQCLLLAQLIEENKNILRGKFGPSVTVQAKRQIWDKIAQQINASFPCVVRTTEDCEKRWYVLQSKAREEIAAHTEFVTDHLGYL